jgi:hypothetical protein
LARPTVSERPAVDFSSTEDYRFHVALSNSILHARE